MKSHIFIVLIFFYCLEPKVLTPDEILKWLLNPCACMCVCVYVCVCVPYFPKAFPCSAWIILTDHTHWPVLTFFRTESDAHAHACTHADMYVNAHTQTAQSIDTLLHLWKCVQLSQQVFAVFVCMHVCVWVVRVSSEAGNLMIGWCMFTTSL